MREWNIRWRLAATAAAVALYGSGPSAAGTGAADADAGAIRLVYDIYGAGLHIARLETTALLGSDRYEIRTQAQSTGLADSIFRARLESYASGSIRSSGPVPEHFRTFSDTRFGVRELEMSRLIDGSFEVAAEPELEPGQAAAMRSGLADKSVDPLTATILPAMYPGEAACTRDVRVFDGRRVFKLDFTPDGEDALAPSGAAVFEGPAVKCLMKYVPVAGQDREWELEEARNPSPPAVLWLARFPAPVAGSDLLLPVRMEVEGTWGAALAHLTVAEIGGQPLIQSAEGGSAPSQMTAAAR